MMDLSLHNRLILIFRNNSTDTVHLSEQGKRALAVEFEKFIDAEIERRNPLTKALESQQVTQLLPALERNFIIHNFQKILMAHSFLFLDAKIDFSYRNELIEFRLFHFPRDHNFTLNEKSQVQVLIHP